MKSGPRRTPQYHANVVDSGPEKQQCGIIEMNKAPTKSLGIKVVNKVVLSGWIRRLMGQPAGPLFQVDEANHQCHPATPMDLGAPQV